jgi:hypothetical protein
VRRTSEDSPLHVYAYSLIQPHIPIHNHYVPSLQLALFDPHYTRPSTFCRIINGNRSPTPFVLQSSPHPDCSISQVPQPQEPGGTAGPARDSSGERTRLRIKADQRKEETLTLLSVSRRIRVVKPVRVIPAVIENVPIDCRCGLI